MDDSIQGLYLRIVLSYSLHAALPVSLAQESQDSLHGQICRGSSSCGPHETSVSGAIFFSLGSPRPHRMRSAHLQVWLHLLFLLCPTTCSFPAGWHSARAHTSHYCLWLQHSKQPLPIPLPIQHSRRNGGKKPMWNSSQKTADRADALPQPHRSDIPAVLILLRRCSFACAREGKVKRDRRCPRLRIIIFYLMS